jgi:hypothetical protein
MVFIVKKAAVGKIKNGFYRVLGTIEAIVMPTYSTPFE